MVDKNQTIKLIDFGFATSTKELCETACGSTDYAAPELFMGGKYYAPSADVWAMGVILFALVTASFPFADAQDAIDIEYDPPGVSMPLLEL